MEKKIDFTLTAITPVPILLAALVKQLDRHHAGIVDDDVQAAKGCGGLFERRSHFGFAADVAGDGQRLAAGGRDLVGDFLAQVGASADERHTGSFLGEEPRRGFADAGGRAADPGHLPRQSSWVHRMCPQSVGFWPATESLPLGLKAGGARIPQD